MVNNLLSTCQLLTEEYKNTLWKILPIFCKSTYYFHIVWNKQTKRLFIYFTCKKLKFENCYVKRQLVIFLKILIQIRTFLRVPFLSFVCRHFYLDAWMLYLILQFRRRGGPTIKVRHNWHQNFALMVFWRLILFSRCQFFGNGNFFKFT